jgi:hypothetical protein
LTAESGRSKSHIGEIPRLNLDDIASKVSGIMKVFLRDARTSLYYGKDMAWVETVKGAAEFATMEEAGGMARECGCEDAVVVLRYENPDCELALDPAYC